MHNGVGVDGVRFTCVFPVKPSKPRCWMDGKLLEGSDVKLSCKSSDGSDPIHYKWERVLDKGKSLGKLPNLALIGKECARMNPSPFSQHFDTQHLFCGPAMIKFPDRCFQPVQPRFLNSNMFREDVLIVAARTPASARLSSLCTSCLSRRINNINPSRLICDDFNRACVVGAFLGSERK